MEPWYSGSVADSIREAKSQQALFIVYVRDDSEQSQTMDKHWTDIWSNLSDRSNIIALRLNKNTESCNQFTAIYKVQTYPTIYFINCQNGQVLKLIDKPIENSNELEELIRNSLNPTEPKQQSTITIDEKVANARARLKELHDQREQETKEKEKQDEMNRRRLGQQMLSDKQKKQEELIRKQAEDVRRDKIEQQRLQEKLKAQIQQDREEKRRRFEEEQQKLTVQQTIPTTPTKTENESPKINYTRSRLQFRLTDGSFFTEDFAPDAHMNDVYRYLQETLPSNQYRNGSYVLRTTHTRTTLTRDNPSTLKELELVPSAVLLVLNCNTVNTPSSSLTSTNIFQSIQLIFAWFMMQFNFIYRFIFEKLFGNRTQTTNPRDQPRSTTNNSDRPKNVKRGNFPTDSTEKSTIRRFHNTQDDSDDEEKRTWNGNSTQQL